MKQYTFYTQHSPMSDPQAYAPLYDAIGDDIPSICRAVQGLIVHYFADGYTPPPSDLCQIDSRTIPAMLAIIMENDHRPLTEPRSIEQRFVGCCRDYTLLAVSILRHKGIPARARYGVATYFTDHYFFDHVVLEYWDQTRWVTVDPELSEVIIAQRNLTFDVHDMPAETFLSGGRAWLMARHAGIDPQRFGIGHLNGWDFILSELLLDLAALNRYEMLCWDRWGYSARVHELSTDDKMRLDDVAHATLDPSRYDEWRTLFTQADLALPQTVHSWSPAADPESLPLTVTY